MPRAAARCAGRTGTEKLPNTTDWYGRFRLAANAQNDYLIDREWQRSRGDYTGHRRGSYPGPGDNRKHGPDLRAQLRTPGQQ